MQIRLIVKRFPHAHEHNVVQPPTFDFQQLTNLKDLIQNLRHCQILGNAHLSRSAKVTRRRATDLTRHTQRRAPGFDPQKDRFDQHACGSLKQQLGGSVDVGIAPLKFVQYVTAKSVPPRECLQRSVVWLKLLQQVIAQDSHLLRVKSQFLPQAFQSNGIEDVSQICQRTGSDLSLPSESKADHRQSVWTAY